MKLEAFEPLTEAEQAVKDGLGTGHVTVLGDGTLPGPESGDDRRVRASLIRWLALGAPGDDAVRLHETGLQIAGALVVSDGEVDPFLKQGSTPGLDLEGCMLAHDLTLFACRFEHAPVLRSAKVQSLFLNGAALPGLSAERLETKGNMALRFVHATGEVRLLGARIGGDLECVFGRFWNPSDADREMTCRGSTGRALNADKSEIRGTVFLRRVEAKGEVRLTGARIRGNLECDGGQFENAGGRALDGQRARVTGTLFWREDSHATGAIDLTGAEIGHINDDPACWPGPGDLLLDRCRYGAFTGTGVSGTERIRWLNLLAPARFGKDFWPQPWEQCATVLREMGHSDDARQVLIAKEERQRRVRRAQAAGNLSKVRGRIAKVERDADKNDIEARLAARSGLVGAWSTLAFLRLRDGLLGALIAYGHKPLRAGLWLLLMLAIGWGVFGVAHHNGGFKPNNAFILTKPEWAQCEARSERLDDPSLTLSCWQEKDAAKGYPAFNAALYSLDTLVPVVDLEVQDFWVPHERAAPWARWYLWAHIGMGWFLALLAVAGFSGLVQTRATEE